MELGLQGKTAIVTGGSKGIGLAVAHELAAEGARVAMCARDAALLDKEAQAMRQATGAEVLPIALDLSQEDSPKRLVEQTLRAFGRIDILVNNAGSISGGSLMEKQEAEWRAQWELKLWGFVRMCREVFPLMLAQQAGRIVNVVGMAAYEPQYHYIAGNMGNAALIGLTKTLALESGRHGVTVNAINPGAIRTPRHVAARQKLAQETGKTPDQLEAEAAPFYRTGRAGEPREVAALIAFLASDRASYINGASIPVDGGGTTHP